MAKNFVHPGKNLTLVAPAAGVTTGLGVLIGLLFVVALTTATSGNSFVGAATGVWSLPKVSTEVWAQGNRVYWDQANARCTTVAAGMREIGVAEVAAANPSATGIVRLNGTKAEINDIGVP